MATVSDFTEAQRDALSVAIRASIAAGNQPQPAQFSTPDGRFICRACQVRQPNETCVGWITTAQPDSWHGLVCKECMG